MKISIPVRRIVALLSALVRYAPGGISPQERDRLVSDLLTIVAELAPESVDVDVIQR